MTLVATMSNPPADLTEAEWAIIKAVWAHQPCAAPTIQEVLQSSQGWACSTVRTLMDRMVAKGLLTAEKVRNLTLYRSAVTPQQAQRGELLYALKHAFIGGYKLERDCAVFLSVTPAQSHPASAPRCPC